jgi:hypothetical protein
MHTRVRKEGVDHVDPAQPLDIISAFNADDDDVV